MDIFGPKILFQMIHRSCSARHPHLRAHMRGRALGYASGQPPPRGPALDRRRWVDVIIADEMENPSLVAREFTKNEIMNRIRKVGKLYTDAGSEGFSKQE